MSAQSDRFRVLRRLTEIRFEDELRGYSKNQVDRVLETLVPLADDVDQLQAKLAEAERRVASAEAKLLERVETPSQQLKAVEPTPVRQRAPAKNEASAPSADFDETLRKTLMLAQQTADTVVREASEEAERVRSSARSDAERITSSSRVEAELVLAESEASRATMFAEVEQERDTLLRAAKDTASRQIAAIEGELATAHESQREELIAQISELQQIRDLLADDIENFEAYLAERREIVRSAMSEINVVLDDPARIRPSIPPQPTAIDAVNPEAYKPIRVELASFAELDSDLSSTADGTVAEAAQIDTPESGERALGPAGTGGNNVDVPASSAVTQAMPGSGSDRLTPAIEDDADASLLSALSRSEDGTSQDGTDSDGSSVDTARSDESGGSSSKNEGVSQDESTGSQPHENADQSDSLLDPLNETNETAPISAVSADSAPLNLGPNPSAAGPATEAVEVIPELDGSEKDVEVSDPWADGEDTMSHVVELSDASPGSAVADEVGEVERPAWAEAVPNVDETSESKSADPFLDELRKATSSDDDEDEALSQFLSDELKEPSRGGWFGRRR